MHDLDKETACIMKELNLWKMNLLKLVNYS